MKLDGDYVITKLEGQGVKFLCSRCARALSSSDENWKEKVVRKELRMDETGMYIPGDDRVVLRQYICPDCGLLLDSEVTLRTCAPFWDFRARNEQIKTSG